MAGDYRPQASLPTAVIPTALPAVMPAIAHCHFLHLVLNALLPMTLLKSFQPQRQWSKVESECHQYRTSGMKFEKPEDARR